MSIIDFKYFKVAEPLDNVQTLADEISLLANNPERYEKLIVDAYEATVIEDIDI